VVVAFHSLEDRIVQAFPGERAKSGGGLAAICPPARRPASFVILTSDRCTPRRREIGQHARDRHSCARP